MGFVGTLNALCLKRIGGKNMFLILLHVLPSVTKEFILVIHSAYDT